MYGYIFHFNTIFFKITKINYKLINKLNFNKKYFNAHAIKRLYKGFSAKQFS